LHASEEGVEGVGTGAGVGTAPDVIGVTAGFPVVAGLFFPVVEGPEGAGALVFPVVRGELAFFPVVEGVLLAGGVLLLGVLAEPVCKNAAS